MKIELTKDWCMNMAKNEERADDAATMCVWCEQRVQGACKSHYDTLTCTHRVIVPTAEEWLGAEAHAGPLKTAPATGPASQLRTAGKTHVLCGSKPARFIGE